MTDRPLDLDETEGRKLYRAKAESLAEIQTAMANRRWKLKPNMQDGSIKSPIILMVAPTIKIIFAAA